MVDFARQPLLSKEKEADLKSKMEPLWLQGLSGMQIAKQLKLGHLEQLLNHYSPGMSIFTAKNSIYLSESNPDSKKAVKLCQIIATKIRLKSWG